MVSNNHVAISIFDFGELMILIQFLEIKKKKKSAYSRYKINI